MLFLSPAAGVRYELRGETTATAFPAMNAFDTTHPPEDLLELIVLAADEAGPDVVASVMAHVRTCEPCRNVMNLLFRMHREIEAEPAVEGLHVDSLLRALFPGTPPESPPAA